MAAAYKEEMDLNLSDGEAIEEVMRGHSTKSEERGYGVRTSKNIVCEALGGEFILISGSAALVSSGGRERLASLPKFHWQGVIIAYRIPRPTQKIDTSPYWE